MLYYIKNTSLNAWVRDQRGNLLTFSKEEAAVWMEKWKQDTKTFILYTAREKHE